MSATNTFTTDKLSADWRSVGRQPQPAQASGLVSTYMKLLGSVVLGYIFLDKGFAYLGFPPLFIGEIVLVLGLGLLVIGAFNLVFIRSPIFLALFLFFGWCLLTAVPSLMRNPMDALRDSAMWYYSLYALIVAGVLLRLRAIERPLKAYGRIVPYFLIWAPAGYLLASKYSGVLPTMPFSQIPVLLLKPGDMQVHVAGAAVFVALGLHRWLPPRNPRAMMMLDIVCWGGVAASLFLIGTQNRGGMLAIFLALGLSMIFRPNNRLKRFIVPAAVIIVALLLIDPTFSPRGGREVSPRQFVENVTSIFDSEAGLQNTVNWRLKWWTKIVDYTLGGQYFWTGKGYAVNLAVADGFYTGDPNRHPHNAHLNFLARSGVPGVIAWLVLQGTICIVLLRCIKRAESLRLRGQANLFIWLLCYWLAFQVNMSFDVYLEGPQGGIPFWSLVGLIIAMSEMQRIQLAARATYPGANHSGARHAAAPEAISGGV